MEKSYYETSENTQLFLIVKVQRQLKIMEYQKVYKYLKHNTWKMLISLEIIKS